MIENLKCPDCGGKMISRLNKAKQQRFWGCADYPKCKGTRDTDGMSKAEREQERGRGRRDDEAAF
jgi:ssDNA-binding Zn-finger/Zn-ribbon topoisomerase 1